MDVISTHDQSDFQKRKLQKEIRKAYLILINIKAIKANPIQSNTKIIRGHTISDTVIGDLPTYLNYQ